VLRRHCEDVGRDYEAIIRSTTINVYLLEEGEDPKVATSLARGGMGYDEYSRWFMVDTSEEIFERLQPMAKAGIGYFITYLLCVAYDPALVEHLARKVISNFA
jgi:hypothetical protein